MKKRITLGLAAALTMSTVAFAQPEPGTFSITPKVGLSMTNMLDEVADELVFEFVELDGYNHFYGRRAGDDIKYRLGFSGGVDFQWHRSERWAFVTGLYYSLQGCRFEHEYHRPDLLGNPALTFVSWDEKDERINLHYFSVPIMAKLYLGHGFALNGGVQVGWLWRAYEKHHVDFVLDKGGDHYIVSGAGDFEQTVEAGKLYGKDINEKITDQYHRVNIEIPVGFSYEYGPYVADVRAKIGTNDIADYGDAKVRNIGFVFSLGYRFDFNIR